MRPPVAGTAPLDAGAVLKSGDLVEVELEIASKNDYEYIVFEDMKPAGGGAYLRFEEWLRAAAALFEPGVPGGADIGALRYFLAPQSWRPPPFRREAE